jgi:hypothetical protein
VEKMVKVLISLHPHFLPLILSTHDFDFLVSAIVDS